MSDLKMGIGKTITGKYIAILDHEGEQYCSLEVETEEEANTLMDSVIKFIAERRDDSEEAS